MERLVPKLFHYEVEAGNILHENEYFQVGGKAVRTDFKLVQGVILLHKVRIASGSMSTPHRTQSRHISKQVVKSDGKKTSVVLVSHSQIRCHLTSTLFPSHSCAGVMELCDVAAKEGTTVEQEGENNNYDTAKSAIRQATKKHHNTHMHLRRIHGERGK